LLFLVWTRYDGTFPKDECPLDVQMKEPLADGMALEVMPYRLTENSYHLGFVIFE